MRRLKNVTITMDEDTARWARIEAARLDVSVSRFIADLLQDRMEGHDRYEDAKRAYLAQQPRVHRRAGQTYPAREEVHERTRLR